MEITSCLENYWKNKENKNQSLIFINLDKAYDGLLEGDFGASRMNG